MKINNFELSSEQLEKFIRDIQKKKELTSLSDKFIEERLVRILKKFPFKLESLPKNLTTKSRLYHQIIKLVRNDLRKVYGLYRWKKLKNDLLNQWLNNPQNHRLLEEILESHASTRERIHYYQKLYPKIFALTGKPRVILDLGCGLNPLTISWMKLEDLTYYAYDISQTEIDLINKFFRDNKIKGLAKAADITAVENFPPADVAFLFKMTEMLDLGKGHKRTEEMLKRIPSASIIVSFPTLTMSGKKMKAPRRRWMEWLCHRLGYSFKIIEIPNELFYIIKK